VHPGRNNPPVGSGGAGELGSWGAGELGSWGAGELGSWGAGELGSWGAGELSEPGSRGALGVLGASFYFNPIEVVENFCRVALGSRKVLVTGIKRERRLRGSPKKLPTVVKIFYTSYHVG